MPRNDDSRGSTGPNRRSVLKAVGASAVAGVAAAGNASADEGPITDLDPFEAEFAGTGRARWAVEEHADAALAELAERGYLDAGDSSAFDLSAVGTDREDARVTAVWLDGDPTAQIEAATETATHEVQLVVRPHLGESYVTARRFDGSDPITVRDEDGDVSIQGCWTESQCTCDPCDLNSCVYQERTCCDGLSDGVDCGSWSDEGCCGACCS